METTEFLCASCTCWATFAFNCWHASPSCMAAAQFSMDSDSSVVAHAGDSGSDVSDVPDEPLQLELGGPAFRTHVERWMLLRRAFDAWLQGLQRTLS